MRGAVPAGCLCRVSSWARASTGAQRYPGVWPQVMCRAEGEGSDFVASDVSVTQTQEHQRQCAPQQKWAARPLSKSQSQGPPKQDQEHAEAQDQGARRGRPWARRLVLSPGLGGPAGASNDNESHRDRQVPLRLLWKRCPGPSEPPQCDCSTVGDVSVCLGVVSALGQQANAKVTPSSGGPCDPCAKVAAHDPPSKLKRSPWQKIKKQGTGGLGRVASCWVQG